MTLTARHRRLRIRRALNAARPLLLGALTGAALAVIVAAAKLAARHFA